MSDEEKDDMEKIVKSDGSLYSAYKYICWDVGDLEATLDGSFGIEYLEFIVKKMKSAQRRYDRRKKRPR